MTMLFAGNAEPPPGLYVLRLPALDIAIEMAIVRVEAELCDLLHICSTWSGARVPDNTRACSHRQAPSSSELVHAHQHACIDALNLCRIGRETTPRSHKFSVFLTLAACKRCHCFTYLPPSCDSCCYCMVACYIEGSETRAGTRGQVRELRGLPNAGPFLFRSQDAVSNLTMSLPSNA